MIHTDYVNGAWAILCSPYPRPHLQPLVLVLMVPSLNVTPLYMAIFLTELKYLEC